METDKEDSKDRKHWLRCGSKCVCCDLAQVYFQQQIDEAENRHHAEKCQRRVFFQEGVESERKRIVDEVEKMKDDLDYDGAVFKQSVIKIIKRV